MRHVLYAYALQIRKKYSHDAVPFANFDGEGTDLLSLFEDFVETYKGVTWGVPQTQEEEDEDVLASTGSVVRVVDIFKKQVTGKVKSATQVGVAAKFLAGDRGIRNDIYDPDQGDDTDPLFKRLVKHVAHYPTLALLHVPGTSTKGYLILHMHGLHGIKSRMWMEFDNWFRDRTGNLFTLDCQPCFPSDWYANLLREQPLTQVTLAKHVMPSDVFDAKDTWISRREVAHVKTIITPPQRGNPLRKQSILDVLDNKIDVKSLLVFQNLTYDHITVTVEEDGKRHTMRLDGGQMARPGYEISEHLKIDPDGHPNMESLYSQMVRYVALLD